MHKQYQEYNNMWNSICPIPSPVSPPQKNLLPSSTSQFHDLSRKGQASLSLHAPDLINPDCALSVLSCRATQCTNVSIECIDGMFVQ
mmetsp:Transcript_90231/g.156236  ORF Transcript_90231/g.156236 Transcript_90231/m.156236 type:complete len:87 (-) Transcript_90231:110-370(-)